MSLFKFKELRYSTQIVNSTIEFKINYSDITTYNHRI